MALRQVTFTYFADDCSNAFPNCDQCDGVVLIPRDPTLFVSGVPYVIAAIVKGPPWEDEAIRYILEFDDVVLANPTYQPVQCDFRVLCYDASARFLTVNLANQAIQVGDTDTVNLNVTTNLITGDVKLSGLPDNQISVNSDGLYVPLAAVSPTACPAPMSRANLIALRNAGGLTKDCDYVINDFVQGNLPAGTLIHLQAVSGSQLSMHVNVATTFDNVAWTGIYDIDANVFRELRDNLGNIVRQSVVSNGSLVTAFDWGNPNYTGNLIEDAVWNVPVGNTRPITRSKFTHSTVFNVISWTAGSIVDTTFRGCSVTFNTTAVVSFTNSELSNSTEIDLTGNVNTTVLNCTLRNVFRLIAKGAGVIILDRVFANNGRVEILNPVTANITITRSIISGNGIVTSRTANGVGTIDILASTIASNGRIDLINATNTATLTVTASTVMDGAEVYLRNGGKLTLDKTTVMQATIDHDSTNTIADVIVNCLVASGSRIQFTNTPTANPTTVTNIAQCSLKGASLLKIEGTTTSPRFARVSLTNGSSLTINNVQENATSDTTVFNISIEDGATVLFSNWNPGVTMICNNTRVLTGANLSLINKTTVGGVSRSEISCGGQLTITNDYGVVYDASIKHGLVVATSAGSVSRMRKSLGGTLTLGGFIHTDIIHESVSNITLTAPNNNRAQLSATGPLI